MWPSRQPCRQKAWRTCPLRAEALNSLAPGLWGRGSLHSEFLQGPLHPYPMLGKHCNKGPTPQVNSTGCTYVAVTTALLAWQHVTANVSTCMLAWLDAHKLIYAWRPYARLPHVARSCTALHMQSHTERHVSAISNRRLSLQNGSLRDAATAARVICTLLQVAPYDNKHVLQTPLCPCTRGSPGKGVVTLPYERRPSCGRCGAPGLARRSPGRIISSLPGPMRAYPD